MTNFKPVIGLEIHVELKTASKMFCQCSASYFGKEPNSNTCPVCLGLPGALPVPNRKAIEWTILIAKALGCQINPNSKFDRKHYFYPDLPKGYQISQYDEPIGRSGKVFLTEKPFRIHRVHLEEDTGKLLHQGEDTLIDFNRSGVPLVEIVTEPDFDNSDEVKRFLEELQVIIRYLDVSDADMEKGSMRLEPNISLKKNDETTLPSYKVEVKNINSFNFVKRAVEYELKRQQELLEKDETPSQETRGFNEAKGVTFSQRKKEAAHDYRYFPEPDIPPLQFAEEFLKKIDSGMPELPKERMARYINTYHIKLQDAFILTRNRSVSSYFEICVGYIKTKQIPDMYQKVANAIINKKVSLKLAQDKFVEQVILLSKTKTTDEDTLKKAVETVISQNEKAVAEYQSGKQNVIMFLLGLVMKEMKGQADANLARVKLEQTIKNERIK